MATKARKTDEQRLKELQTKIDRRKQATELRKTIETAKANLAKLRGK